MRIGVPREIFPGEKRVATVPDVVTRFSPGKISRGTPMRMVLSPGVV